MISSHITKIPLYAVAKPARQFGHAIGKFFCVYRPYKDPISKEMNNDNDLNLHSMTKLSGWLRYCLYDPLGNLFTGLAPATENCSTL